MIDPVMSGAADSWPYSAREAATLLGISERTIRRAIARGDLPATKHAGVFRIAPEDLTLYSGQHRRSSRLQLVETSSWPGSRPEPFPAPHPLHRITHADAPPPEPPLAHTTFLGRDREIAAVVAMLDRPEIRLLTLTGPGGVGKTRLALRVAREVKHRFADGIVFAALAPVTEPGFVPSSVALALGLRELDDRPIGERVVAALRDRQALLVLDNFEHVLAAAPFVAGMLAGCPSLTVLVTSRTALGVSGEHRFLVPPMALPDPVTVGSVAAARQVDAVQLFMARAQAVQPSLELTVENVQAVAEICWHLDGLPLAIELAAARLSVLPPQTLLAKLEPRLPLLTNGPRDAPHRLQTMRSAIAWSFDLLSMEEQALFRRLAVFSGGCTLEGAAAIADSGHDVLAGISSLVESSVLRQEARPGGDPRFVMLETIREFGLEQLVHAGQESETRQQHVTYCLELCERGYPNHFGPFTNIDQRLQQLEDELPNLRAAFAFLASVGDAHAVLRLAGALALFWLRRGHLREGRRWLEWALANTPEAQTDARGRALVGLGSLLWAQGESEQATPLARAALAIANASGDRESAAHAVHLLGLIAEAQQAWDEAESLFIDALARWRALDAWVEEAVALLHLSAIVFSRGDRNLAAQFAEASLTRFRASEYASGASLALCRLAFLARDRGESHAAALAYHEALGLWASRNDRWYIRLALAGLAEIAGAYGLAPAAARLLGSIDTLVQDAGGVVLSPPLVNYDRATIAAREALGAEQFNEFRAAGQRLRPGEAVAIAAAIPVPTTAASEPLTLRQTEVLRLIAAGYTDQEIADRFFISRRTVNAHVAHILTRLEVHTRHEATARARMLGLLPNGEPERYT